MQHIALLPFWQDRFQRASIWRKAWISSELGLDSVKLVHVAFKMHWCTRPAEAARNGCGMGTRADWTLERVKAGAGS
jgi:hypothetical protein